MIAPMTRRALWAAVRPYQPALVEWFGNVLQPLPRALTRAGFKKLRSDMLGIERVVLIGRGLAVKTLGWNVDEPASSPHFRRVRSLAPTIAISPTIIVQPLGRVMSRCRGPRWARVRRMYERVAEYVERRYDISDTHPKNYALFPDGSVRCIDF